MQRKTLLFTVLVLLVCALFYVPVPPKGTCEPRFKVFSLWFVSNAAKRLVVLGYLLGYGFNIHRQFCAKYGWLRLPATDPDLEIEDVLIEGVFVRKYTPKFPSAASNPAIVYFHGGGWSTLNIDTYEGPSRALARRSRFTVFSVEYRLAPENPFPIPFEDCLKVTQHFLSADNAKQHNIDNKRIAVMGDSAGGNLAAAVSLKLRGESAKPKLQILIYPALQAFNFQTPSYQLDNPPLLDQTSMVVFWLNYLNSSLSLMRKVTSNEHTSESFKKSAFSMFDVEKIEKRYFVSSNYQKAKDDFGDGVFFEELREKGLTNPFACPLLAETLKGVPPAFVLTAEFDVLRDDGVAYVEKLRNDNIPVRHYHSQSGFHGFFFPQKEDILNLDCSEEAWQEVIQYLRVNL